MIRNLRLIKALIRMRMTHLMLFRFSFFSNCLVDIFYFIVQILVFATIYSNVDTIGGWTQGEVCIFIGTFSLINAFNMTIFFFGVAGIPDKIKSGTLDYYLTKPANPLVRLTFESFNPGSIILIFMSIVIIMYGVFKCGVVISIIKWMEYVFIVIAMTVLYYDIELIIRTISFFSIATVNVTRVEELLDVCMRVPGVLFKGFFKIFFYFILPYGIIATIPTQILMSIISWKEIVYGYAIVVFYTLFALKFWKFGLKNYKSASS